MGQKRTWGTLIGLSGFQPNPDFQTPDPVLSLLPHPDLKVTPISFRTPYVQSTLHLATLSFRTRRMPT